MNKNILVVEDEKDIIDFIINRIDNENYNIDTALDGNEALKKINNKTYDLITLDIMLPFVDGFEIAKRIRDKSKNTLIVMLSALDSIEFKEKGYDCGIDDYISKPFSPKELAIKIKSLLKRKEELNNNYSNIITNVLINENLKQIIINGFEIEFTPSEYFILSILILNKNRVYSRNELAQLIYDNYFGEIDEQGINTHIYNIREKIKKYYDKELIKTVRGMGYKINET